MFQPAAAQLTAGEWVLCGSCGRKASRRLRPDAGGVEVKCKCGALVAA
jgi:hypothetical protein